MMMIKASWQARQQQEQERQRRRKLLPNARHGKKKMNQQAIILCQAIISFSFLFSCFVMGYGISFCFGRRDNNKVSYQDLDRQLRGHHYNEQQEETTTTIHTKTHQEPIMQNNRNQQQQQQMTPDHPRNTANDSRNLPQSQQQQTVVDSEQLPSTRSSPPFEKLDHPSPPLLTAAILLCSLPCSHQDLQSHLKEPSYTILSTSGPSRLTRRVSVTFKRLSKAPASSDWTHFMIITLRDNEPLYEHSDNGSLFNSHTKTIHAALSEVIGGEQQKNIVVSTNWEETAELLGAGSTGDVEIIEQERPKFQTFEDLFQKLNQHFPDFQYVIQRSWDEDWPSTDFVKDIDILVSDFYFFKALSGARSNSRNKSRELGGVHIQETVNIMGKEKAFDVRYIGDNFIDNQWEADMLDRAIKNEEKNLYTPCLEDQIVYEMYYAIYNKPEKMAAKIPRLRELTKLLGIPKSELDVDSADRRVRFVQAFMKRQGYTFTRPKDTSVALIPNFPASK